MTELRPSCPTPEAISEGCTGIFITMQIILLVKTNHSSLGGSEMPAPYGDFLKAVSFIALDVIQWLPLNCAYEDGFSAWDALVAVTISPLAAFVLVLIFAQIRTARGASPLSVAHVLGYFFQVGQ
jgi:hypothetical protein